MGVARTRSDLTRTHSGPCVGVTSVSRVFKSICLLIAILWVPMTQHCLLEAAGNDVTQCDHAMQESCAHDGCGIVEGGGYQSKAGFMKLAAPALLLFACFLWAVSTPDLKPRESTITDEALARPLDWVPVWQFVQRAAPPARAPSFIG